MTFYYQDLTENNTSIPIINGTPTLKVVYSVFIPNIYVGDILKITSAFEVTNNYAYNAMIGSYIILGTSATATTGTILDPANAWNVTPAMHHGVVVKARQWQATADYTDAYINVIGYGSSVNALGGDAFVLEQGYGHLDVVIN